VRRTEVTSTGQVFKRCAPLDKFPSAARAPRVSLLKRVEQDDSGHHVLTPVPAVESLRQMGGVLPAQPVGNGRSRAYVCASRRPGCSSRCGPRTHPRHGVARRGHDVGYQARLWAHPARPKREFVNIEE
jgi:hypothetical protein